MSSEHSEVLKSLLLVAESGAMDATMALQEIMKNPEAPPTLRIRCADLTLKLLTQLYDRNQLDSRLERAERIIEESRDDEDSDE